MPPTKPNSTSPCYLVIRDNDASPFLVLRPNRNPKEIVTGSLSGRVTYGIYRIEKNQLHVVSSEDVNDRPSGFDRKQDYTYSVFARDEGEPLDQDAKILVGDWVIQNKKAVAPDLERVTLKGVEYRNELVGTILGRKTRRAPDGRKRATLSLTLDSNARPKRIQGRITIHENSADHRLHLDGHYSNRDGIFHFRVRFAELPWALNPPAWAANRQPNLPVWEFALKQK